MITSIPNYKAQASTLNFVKFIRFNGSYRRGLPELPQSLYDGLFKKKWVVYAKPPFGRPEHVIEYLGRYTHKIAIGNHRILDIDKEKWTVTFSLKDYRKGGQRTKMTLQGIHASFPAPYTSQGLYTDPALRIFEQQLEKGRATAVTTTIGKQRRHTRKALLFGKSPCTAFAPAVKREH